MKLASADATTRKNALRLMLAVALSALCGAGCDWLGVPLAWMLGPLLGTAALSLAGAEVRFPQILRRIGQATVGTTVGLYITASVAVQLVTMLPLMVAAALLVVGITCVLSLFLSLASGSDHKTSFLAMMPGGVAEMGNLAVIMGASPMHVSVGQSLRVASMVLVIPPLLIFFFPASDTTLIARPQIDTILALALIGGGLSFAFLVRRTGLNNPWMLGSALFCGVLAGSSVVSGSMPPVVFAIGQLLLGMAIGSRFRRDEIVRMPRFILAYLLQTCILIGLVSAIVFLIHDLVSLPTTTMLLAMAPGGLAEMSTTASLLGASVTTVTGFHIVRSFLVNGFVTHYWSGLLRVGFFASGDRVLRRIFRVGAK